MNAPITTQPATYGLLPALAVPPDLQQFYWQTLYMHDWLKYRLCNVENPTWSDAKDMIRRCGAHVYYIWNTVNRRIEGEITLENFTGKSAQIHFSSHPEVSIQQKLAYGRYALDQILYHWKDPVDENIPFLFSVFGLTPVTNRLACRFVLHLGLQKIGVLPGGIVDRGQLTDAMITIKAR